MKNDSIHRYIVKRLLAVFISLSAVVCAFDFFYELEKVDERVLQLALDESSHFREDEVNLIRAGDLIGLAANASAHLKYSEFLVIEFYDAQKKRLVETAQLEAKAIEKEFNKLPHEELLGSVARYQKLEHGGRLYLRVACPLVFNGEIAGYFEGLYAVGDAVLRAIKGQMIVSLLKVVGVIFMTTVVLYPVVLSLNRKVLKYADVLQDANIGTLESLGNAIAKRDSDTSEHNYRVTLYAIELGTSLGLDNSKLRELVKGAFLHDVGKIAISDSILLKPGKLTAEEFDVMKTHVSHGVEILEDYEWLREAGRVVEFHHEKFDGTGYSKGLSGREIPEAARIFCIVDVFDALTSKRPYKEAFSYEKSLAILREGQGTHFDPEILGAFEPLSKMLYNTVRSADESTLKHTLRRRIREIFT